jgi:hypothetical protein
MGIGMSGNGNEWERGVEMRVGMRMSEWEGEKDGYKRSISKKQRG